MAEARVLTAGQRVVRTAAGGYRAFRRWPVIPILILVGAAVMAIFAPMIAPQSPYDQALLDRNAPPSWINPQWYVEHPKATRKYLLGADYVGRDVLSRIIHGSRISLQVISIAISAGMVVGSALGLVSGYFGGWLDEIAMRLVDVWLSLPFILIAMVVAMVFGATVVTIMGVLAMMAWSMFVRNVRAEVLSLRTRDYVSLAHVAGASTPRILIRHILPGVMNTILVLATLRVGQLIIAEATLSYLGAGIPSPTPAWGLMVSEGRDYVNTAWWTALFPGCAIFLLVLAFNFLGDWFRDRFDPRLRQL